MYRSMIVPEPEQRLWRTVTRKKYQLTRHVARVRNQLEALLEEAHIKLSSPISDLLGVSGRRACALPRSSCATPASSSAGMAILPLRQGRPPLCGRGQAPART
jgi:hypothetical protein